MHPKLIQPYNLGERERERRRKRSKENKEKSFTLWQGTIEIIASKIEDLQAS